MAPRKHYSMEECSTRRWFSRTEWRRRGVVIDAHEKRMATCWNGKGAFDVYAEHQGTRRKLSFVGREAILKRALEQIVDGVVSEGVTEESYANRLRNIARVALKAAY